VVGADLATMFVMKVRSGAAAITVMLKCSLGGAH
jgi:hypothetical protein